MFHYITFISFPLSLTVKTTINNTETLRFHSKTSFLVIKSGCLMAKIHSTRTTSSRTQDVEKTVYPPHRVPQQGGSEDARLLIGRLLDLKSSCGGKVVRFVIWVEAGKNTVIICLIYILWDVTNMK